MKSEMTIKDILEMRDNTARPVGHVKIYSKQTKRLLFEGLESIAPDREGFNKVIVPGSILAARKFFPNAVPPIVTPTYNSVLGLDGITSLTATEQRDAQVILFAVGNDGCGRENSQVINPDYTKWIAPASLFPMRYVPQTADLSPDDRTKYFGRKVQPNGKVAYYFKAFDTDPVMNAIYKDGTTMDENLYTTDNTTGGLVYVEMKMSIEEKDCVEFVKDTVGLSGGINPDAAFSSISLLTATPKSINGYTYYQDIRPMTKYNFSPIQITEEFTGWDIIYDLYF